MISHPMLVHNNTNILRIRGSESARLQLDDIVSLNGDAAFGYSAWIRPLAPLRPRHVNGNTDPDPGFLIGTKESGWRLSAHDGGVSVYRWDQSQPFLTLPCRISEDGWHFVRVGWSRSDIGSAVFRLTLAVDEFSMEGFDASINPPVPGYPQLHIGGGSLPMDIMCLSVWSDPEAIEHNPMLMPEHTPALKACFCFADSHPLDMSGNQARLEYGIGCEHLGSSRALTLRGGATAEIGSDILESLRRTGSGAATIHAWVRPVQLGWTDPATGAVASLDTADHDALIALQSGDGIVQLELRPKADASRSEVLLNDGRNAPLVLGSVAQNEWAHLALVIDNGRLSLIVDGVLSCEAPTGIDVNRVSRLALGGIEPAGDGSTPFRGHVCSLGLWSSALSPDKLRAVSESLEFLDPQCVAWYGLGEAYRLADSFSGSPLILRGGGSVQEVIGRVTSFREHVESYAVARFRKPAATIAASGPWAGFAMAGPRDVTGSIDGGSETGHLEAALMVLRPGLDATELDAVVRGLAAEQAKLGRNAASSTASPRAILLAATAMSSQCAGLLVAIICDVIAIIFSAVGLAIAGTVVRNALGGTITGNLPKIIQTLKTIDFAKVEGIRKSTPIFLRLVSALFGTTSGMPSFRAIIQSVFSNFRWWDVAFFVANVGLLIGSIILTGGGAVIVILATLATATFALGRDIGLYVDAGCHR